MKDTESGRLASFFDINYSVGDICVYYTINGRDNETKVR